MPSKDFDELSGFASRAKKGVRVKLPAAVKLRLQRNKKQRWFRRKRAWRKKYQDYLRSEKWKRKRARRLKKANGICEYCFKVPAVHVHHLTYERIFKERIDDLRAVCLDCHENLHPKKKAFWRKKRRRENSGTRETKF